VFISPWQSMLPKAGRQVLHISGVESVLPYDGTMHCESTATLQGWHPMSVCMPACVPACLRVSRLAALSSGPLMLLFSRPLRALVSLEALAVPVGC